MGIAHAITTTPGSVPAFGWRMWKLSDDGYLTSKWGAGDTYRTSTITAECEVFGCLDIPGPNCRCGIYFLEDHRALIHEIHRLTAFERKSNPKHPFPVVTLVEPIGRTVDAPLEPLMAGAKVWRAAAVEILAIVVDSDQEHLRGRIESNYDGVPVIQHLTEITLSVLEKKHTAQVRTARTAPAITNTFFENDVQGIGWMLAEQDHNLLRDAAQRPRCTVPGCQLITRHESRLCPQHRYSQKGVVQ